ncbi:MAG: response regulator [Deltaproteobacteria bacterium]|nr:response regulator [Deltaproteobacteria bacterium]
MKGDPELLDSFLEEARDHLGHIRELLAPAHRGQALGRAELERLAAHVHNLKGVSGLMGFSHLHVLVGYLLAAFERIGEATGDHALVAPELAGAAVTSLERMIANIEEGKAEANEACLLDFEVGAEIFEATASSLPDSEPVAELAEALGEEVGSLCATVQGELFAALDASRPAERQRAAARARETLEGLPATALIAGRQDVSHLATAFLDLLSDLSVGRQPATPAAVDLSLRLCACLERLADPAEAQRASELARDLVEEARSAARAYLGDEEEDEEATSIHAELDAEEVRELEALFLEEAQGHLATAREALAGLRTGLASEATEAIRHFFRAVHTLKGAAGTAGRRETQALCHGLEETLGRFRESGAAPAAAEIEALAVRLAELERSLPGAPAEAPPPSPAPAAPAAPVGASLRVPSGKLDQLLLRGGELLAARSRLSDAGGRLRELSLRIGSRRRSLWTRVDEYLVSRPVSLALPPEPTDEEAEAGVERYDEADILARDLAALDHELGESVAALLRLSREVESDLEEVSRLAADYQDGLTHLRFIPMEELLRRFLAPVREWAAQEGKQVEIELDGGEAELDRAVAEALADPLLHLTRNAIAHGIEAPAERVAAGKAPAGHLRLLARGEGPTVLLEVVDDGRGLEPARLREAAVSRGLLPAEEAASLSDARACDLIFTPGFSTRQEADALAGRGVGLDAVAHRVASLGGVISVAPVEGGGTRFLLRVPASVAILPVLEVETGGHRLALPLAAVRETMLVDRRELQGKRRLRWESDELRTVDPREILHLPPRESSGPRRRPVVIVGHGESNAAVIVDRLVGRSEGLLQPLGPILGQLPLYSSAVLAGDGHLLLVMDVSSLLSASLGARLLPASELGPALPRAPEVLVVDDSLSVRRHLEKTLRAAGYQVRCAVDGADALAEARASAPDLILTDLEMPVLHGFELMEELRRDPGLAGLPVLVITSRTGDTHRERSRALGAREVLGKPVPRARLLDAVAEALGSGRLPDA